MKSGDRFTPPSLQCDLIDQRDDAFGAGIHSRQPPALHKRPLDCESGTAKIIDADAMLARLQQTTTFALIGIALAWAIVHASRGAVWVGIAGAMFIVFSYAIVLAVEMLVARQVNRDEAVGPADAAALCRAWSAEVRCSARTFFWNQPFRSQAVPDRLSSADADRVGIVLVHGFVCNRGLWNPWLRRFRDLRIPFAAVNLEPVFGGIDSYAAAIDAAVRRVGAVTGRPPIVVAHSMGGLAVRAWLSAHDAASRVQSVITLGTPHHGTVLASLAVSANARQMRRSSPWLKALEQCEPAGLHASFTCYYSNCDNIVMPASTATLRGADNRQLSGVAHVQMASDERVFREILARIRHVSRPAG